MVSVGVTTHAPEVGVVGDVGVGVGVGVVLVGLTGVSPLHATDNAALAALRSPKA